MTGPLVVHLNRDGLHSIEPESDAVRTSRGFTVELRNHGQAVHVHLHLSDGLAGVAGVEEANHFVDTGATRGVLVRVTPRSTPSEGTIAIVTAYGDAREEVALTVEEPADPEPVAVDESLGDPPARPRGDALEALLADADVRRVGLVGAGALLLALVAVVLAPSAVVAAGAVTVIAGVAVAGYLLVD